MGVLPSTVHRGHELRFRCSAPSILLNCVLTLRQIILRPLDEEGLVRRCGVEVRRGGLCRTLSTFHP